MGAFAAAIRGPRFAVRQESRSRKAPCADATGENLAASARSATAEDAIVRSTAGAQQQMPLSFLKSGEVARVVKVRGAGELHHHLENLGFVEGAAVKVVGGAGGDLIIDVKGAQVALGRQAAQRIVIAPAA